MKVTLWAFLKVVLITLLSIGIITYRVDSIEDARGTGTALALGFGLVAVFQLVLWFFYDIVTLRRGGWRARRFHQNPFATHQGPGLHLTVTSVVLIVFGILKTLPGSFYGLPSVVLGDWRVSFGLAEDARMDFQFEVCRKQRRTKRYSEYGFAVSLTRLCESPR